jgi:hypothetical protein
MTQGIGDGDYEVEVTKISEDESDSTQATKSTAIFEGVAKQSEVAEMIAIVEGKEVIGGSGEKDETAPNIIIANPKEKEYINSGKLDFAFTISDDVSKEENISVKKYLDGQETDQDGIEDLSLQKTGSHDFKIEAIDEAGNSSEKKISFEVKTDLPTIVSNIEHYKKSGIIKKNASKVLKRLVENVIRMEKISDLVKNSKHVRKKDKERLEKIINDRIPRYLYIIMKFVDRLSKKHISQEGKELLLGSLGYVRDHLSE